MTDDRFDEQVDAVYRELSQFIDDELMHAVKASGLISETLRLQNQFSHSDFDFSYSVSGFIEGQQYASDAFSDGPLTGIDEQDWERQHDDEAAAVRRFCELATSWTPQDWYDRILVWEHVAAVELWKLMFVENNNMGVDHFEVAELFEDIDASADTGFEETIFFGEHYIHAFARGMLAVYKLRNVCEWPQRVSLPSKYDVETGPFADLLADVVESVKQALQVGEVVRKKLIDVDEEMILKYGVTTEQIMAKSDEERTELERNESEEPDEEGEEWKRGLPDEDN